MGRPNRNLPGSRTTEPVLMLKNILVGLTLLGLAILFFEVVLSAREIDVSVDERVI